MKKYIGEKIEAIYIYSGLESQWENWVASQHEHMIVFRTGRSSGNTSKQILMIPCLEDVEGNKCSY